MEEETNTVRAVWIRNVSRTIVVSMRCVSLENVKSIWLIYFLSIVCLYFYSRNHNQWEYATQRRSLCEDRMKTVSCIKKNMYTHAFAIWNLAKYISNALKRSQREIECVRERWGNSPLNSTSGAYKIMVTVTVVANRIPHLSKSNCAFEEVYR